MESKDQRFHLLLMGLSAAHRQHSMQQFYQLGLTTGQPKILSVLFEQEGYLQKDLSKRCKVEPATMTSLLRKMQEKGLICKKKVSVSGGKKAYSIYLTEEGRKTAGKVNEIVEEAEKISFQGIEKEDKKKFLGIMEQVTRNLTDKELM